MEVLKTTAKTTAWFLTGIIALLVILLLAIQTPFAKRQIVSVAERQAGKLLNAELAVGRLTGNFFSHIALEDLALRSPEGDTIASVARVSAGYNLKRLIFNNTLWVDSVAIDRPYIHLHQLPDSTWNLARLVRPAGTPKDTTASAPFGMDVVVRDFLLQNARARIDALNPAIPRRVDSLSFELQGGYIGRELWADLHGLRFTASQPGLRLEPSSFSAEATPEAIERFRLELQTPHNGLRLLGRYDFSRQTVSEIMLLTDSIHFDEFLPWLPEGFPVHAQPRLLLDVHQLADSLKADFFVYEGEQQLWLGASAKGVMAWLDDTAAAPPVGYAADLFMQHVDPGYWLGRPGMDYLLNANLHATGRGFDPHTLEARLWGHFDSLRVEGQRVERLSLSLAYDAGNLTGNIDGQGRFGTLRLTPQVQQLPGGTPRYQIGLATSHLDAYALTGDTALRTDINLRADVAGCGFDPERLDARAHLSLRPSAAFGIGIDTLDTRLAFAAGNLTIGHLTLDALDAHMQARGNYSLTGHSELWLEAQADSMSRISRLTGLDGLETRARINAHAYGRPGSLQADLQATAADTRYDAVGADSLHLDARAALAGENLDADARLKIYHPAAGNLALDSIALQAATDMHDHRLSFDARGKELNARFDAIAQTGDAIRVALSGLELGYQDYLWKQASDTAFARITGTEYELRDFRIATTGDTLPSSLYVDGRVSRTDSQQVVIRADRIGLQRLLSLAGLDLPLNGLARLNLNLTGEAASPRLDARLDIDSTTFGSLRFDTVQTGLQLLDHHVAAALTIVPDGLGRISGEGALPAHIRLDSMAFQIVPSADDSIRASLRIEDVPLAVAQLFIDNAELKGMLNSHIGLTGTPAHPRMAGTLRLDSGAVRIAPYGIDYRNMQADIRLTESQARIGTFLIESPGGTMAAQGGVQFRSALYNAELDSSRLDITFDRFNPFSHKQFKMEMSGDIGVQANADSTTFAGNITIPEANIYLPAVMALMGRFSTPDMPQPLLVAELERLTQPGDSLVYTFRPDTTAAADTARSKLAFLDNLQGEAKVSIPRNTWIRNDDMRLELSGDVRLVKHRDFFELFGTIDVVRGQYNLLGKVFVIQSGTVTLQGGERIDPVLDINAVYTFRDPYRNKRDLGITVTGGMDDLTIKFKLEGEEIGEGDALSYIIFGRALNELSASESSGIDPGKLAGMAAASLISSQLTKWGNAFNVDYIEVDVGSSFDNASLTVGKYITNKLFISYEQRIGALEDKDTARYEMTLEYELFKFLFLQLTSSPVTNGFDVIFKLDSKQ